MNKTVKEHFEDCKQVSEVVDNANALLTKVQTELKYAREVLEKLVDYQHPKLIIATAYMSWLTKDDKMTPDEMIRAEVRRINNLLGDRA